MQRKSDTEEFEGFLQSIAPVILPVGFEPGYEQYTQNYHKDIWYNRLKTIQTDKGEVLQGTWIFKK